MKETIWDNGDRKAIIIEIMDIVNKVWDANLNCKLQIGDEELKFHRAVITEAIRKAAKEGYTKYKILTREEAEKINQDIGINGLYLIYFKR